jgi:hypothetical protein
MNQPIDIDAILARRQQIASEIERLTAEDKELEIAIRVAERFGKRKANGAAHAAQSEEGSRLGPPRPPGTPPLLEMANTVLKEAIAAGKSGLKGNELVAAIGDRFWPGVQARQIMPPIYHFAKVKRLKKGDNGIFKPV